MTTSTRRRPLLIVIGVLIAGAILTGGILTSCDRETPRPTPTPSVTTTPTQTPTPTPTDDPADDEKQANIDAAKAAYGQYNAAWNKVGMAGMVGWETELRPLISGEQLWARLSNFFTQAAEQGLVKTGETTIAAVTVTEYVTDTTGAGHEQVRMDVCLDNSASDFVDPNGHSVTLEGYPPRLIEAVVMQHQDDGRWTIAQATTMEGQTC